MRNILLLTCSVCLISTMTIADDTIPETCAGGAGTIFIGKVTDHKYCISNNTMNLWNAYAWCDGMRMRLFHLNDCAKDGLSNYTKCPEIMGVSSKSPMLWTHTPTSNNKWYVIENYSGYTGYTYGPHSSWHAVCK